MHYDIAVKRLMEMGGKDILQRLAGLEAAYLDALHEAGQETFEVKRCDFAGLYQCTDGKEGIAIIEFQTRWDPTKPLDMAIYSAQHRRRHRLPVLPLMVLFTPDRWATRLYEDECLSFRFRLVRLWEMPASDWLGADTPWLWPLAALAKDGEKGADSVDAMLHEAALPRREKSDLLTILAVLLGLKDARIAERLITKRREIMIESPIYEIIKTEGRVEGRAEGRVEGRLEARLSSLIEILDERFGPLPETMLTRLNGISSVDKMSVLIPQALRTQTLEEFSKQL